jgi:hypothetical protein
MQKILPHFSFEVVQPYAWFARLSFVSVHFFKVNVKEHENEIIFLRLFNVQHFGCLSPKR